MARNTMKRVTFGHPKWPTAAILSTFPKIKLRINLKLPEM